AAAAAEAVVARGGARLRAGALVSVAIVSPVGWSVWVSEKFSTSTPSYVVGNEQSRECAAEAARHTRRRRAPACKDLDGTWGSRADFAEVRRGQIHELTWSPPLDP